MGRCITMILGALLAFPLLCFAQDLHPGLGVTVEVPFGFYAGEKMLPPGTYSITEGDLENEVKITDLKSQENTKLQIFTRLGLRPDAEVLFDKVGDVYRLSEVYIPGLDGFLFKAAQGKHTHIRIQGKK
jgi:hypothetical protein